MKRILLVVVTALLAAPTYAGLISVSGGSPSQTPAGNAYIPAGLDGYWEGAVLALTVAQDVELTYEYVGSEASNFNLFEAPDGSFINRGFRRASAGDTIVSIDSGILDFGFTDLSSCGFLCEIFGGDDDSVENGGPASAIDFWTGAVTGTGGNTWWIGLNDSGGDLDYDDLVLKVTARAIAVTEPGTLALIGIGLVGLGLMRRKT